MNTLPLAYAMKSRDDALAILEDRDRPESLKRTAWLALKNLRRQGIGMRPSDTEPPEAA